VQDQHFVHCALTGERPDTDGRTGLTVVAVLEAIETAIRECRRVPVVYPDVVPYARPLTEATS
jgi:predicted dehydrogenase